MEQPSGGRFFTITRLRHALGGSSRLISDTHDVQHVPGPTHPPQSNEACIDKGLSLALSFPLSGVLSDSRGTPSHCCTCLFRCHWPRWLSGTSQPKSRPLPA